VKGTEVAGGVGVMLMQVERYVAFGMPGTLWQHATMSQSGICSHSCELKLASSEHSVEKNAREQPIIPTQQPASAVEEHSKKMPTSKNASKNLFFAINPPLLQRPKTTFLSGFRLISA
jgi:hypothetical protein